ncbi:WPP domain-interacting tail-anchored protein 1-like isoform X2 [Aristolochia californica]|uniref:WPP domain-interacting tail-anchored protein 1-like isoform X2 n=1 Tax=Aristolochia californica TaxID=171875 RepID=UPI0035DB06DD
MAFQDAPDRTSISMDKADADGRPIQSDGVISPQAFSPHAEKIRELGNAGILTRIDLDLAYFSEKLLNLQIILIDVTNRANDYEALALEGEYISPESLQKSLEFDFLSVVFDSEVRELDNFMSSVQMDIVEAREKVSVCENLEEFFLELAGKLEDSEESLKQLQDQVSKMRIQSAKFQSITDCCRQEYWHHEVLGVVENSLFSLGNAKLTMQTSEQQRHILRMLEKSLARELELENNLSESISNEEELLLKLNYMEREREVCCTETAEISLETLFEAQNMADVLMGISKELLGQLHIANFSLNSSTRQKDEVISKVGLLEKQLQDMNIQLERARSSVKASQEQQNSLHVKIHELESVIDNLEEKLSKVENNYVSAETKCKLLADTNLELNEEIAFLRSSSNTGQIDLLEKQLKQSDTQLQHAKAMIEANQEQQTMLYSAVSDMGNLIEDLKTKVSKAESRADSAEARCVLLTETKLEHSEEMSFLRGRIECLEASLRQADDAKIATANAIDMRAKVISNLLMQLAVERERLQIQVDYVKEKPQTEKEGDNVSHKDDLDMIDTVRTIEAGQLNLKYVIMAIVICLISWFTIYLFQQETRSS